MNYVSNNKSFAGPTVTILKQINQLNDDGSYTFGYEASDGSFRVESMDAKGYLTGRYGYVDSNGKQQETGISFVDVRYPSYVWYYYNDTYK